MLHLLQLIEESSAIYFIYLLLKWDKVLFFCYNCIQTCPRHVVMWIITKMWRLIYYMGYPVQCKWCLLGLLLFFCPVINNFCHNSCFRLKKSIRQLFFEWCIVLYVTRQIEFSPACCCIQWRLFCVCKIDPYLLPNLHED